MSTLISEECINYGACQPECPNGDIYEGGTPWELDGLTHPARRQDVFYIAAEKSTECVGFFAEEQCGAV